MAHRRLSSAEKGKGMDLNSQQPLRTARVKVPLPDNSELLRKHHLTLIGRVTNKSIQKVWSLIPFFTEHWKTEFKPIGADLGNGMFQFQFEREADLLSVLEQRPYHYARWMVIIQRWEPTVSPSFPSLIPFWIKVQGLPVHLWTEATIKCIGEDIGLYEKAEITAVSARMRVHIDGCLPLIKSSVVEFPNGDEVTTTLFYERLDKHCTKCLRLDHDIKECLVARAEAKALKASQEEAVNEGHQKEKSDKMNSHIQPGEVRSSGSKAKDYRKESSYKNTYSEEQQNSYPIRDDRRYGNAYSNYREGNESWRDRGRTMENSSRYHPYKRRENIGNTTRNQVYREVRRTEPMTRQSVRGTNSQTLRSNVPNSPQGREEIQREESSSSKALLSLNARGNPLQSNHQQLDQNALAEALGEVRDAMTQYTLCADPTESAARQERMRKAEEKGELEETAARMVRASLPRRTPSPVAVDREASPGPMERIPATLRLGPPIGTPVEELEDLPLLKRKPGRPTGSKKISNSPRNLVGASSRKRKVQNNKPPLCRRSLSTGTEKASEAKKRTRSKPSNSRGSSNNSGKSHSSDNVPLRNMIPKVVRKRVDFRDPPPPLP